MCIQIGTLSVKLLQQNLLSEALWQRSEQYGNLWIKGQVTITNQNVSNYRLVLEGTQGDGMYIISTIRLLVKHLK